MFNFDAGLDAALDEAARLFHLDRVWLVLQAHEISQPWLLTHSVNERFGATEVFHKLPSPLAI